MRRSHLSLIGKGKAGRSHLPIITSKRNCRGSLPAQFAGRRRQHVSVFPIQQFNYFPFNSIYFYTFPPSPQSVSGTLPHREGHTRRGSRRNITNICDCCTSLPAHSHLTIQQFSIQLNFHFHLLLLRFDLACCRFSLKLKMNNDKDYLIFMKVICGAVRNVYYLGALVVKYYFPLGST